MDLAVASGSCSPLGGLKMFEGGIPLNERNNWGVMIVD